MSFGKEGDTDKIPPPLNEKEPDTEPNESQRHPAEKKWVDPFDPPEEVEVETDSGPLSLRHPPIIKDTN